MQTLVIPRAASTRLLTYLNEPKERIAFLLAEPKATGDRWTVADEMYLGDGVDYAYQGEYGMDLADDVRPRVLQWACRPGVALIEVHSHGGLGRTATTFSPTDLEGLDEIVPQMLWRLRGRPYTALVLGCDDLDALTWARPDAPPTVPCVVVLGDRAVAPTGLALNILTAQEDA